MQTCDRELLRQLDSRYGPNDARRRGMSQPAACNSRPKMRRGGQIQRHLELWLGAAGLVAAAAAAWMSWHREPSKQAVSVIARGSTRTKSQCLTTAPRHAGGTNGLPYITTIRPCLSVTVIFPSLFFTFSHFSSLLLSLDRSLCFQIYDTGHHGITNSHSEATWCAIARQHL